MNTGEIAARLDQDCLEVGAGFGEQGLFNPGLLVLRSAHDRDISATRSIIERGCAPLAVEIPSL